VGGVSGTSKSLYSRPEKQKKISLIFYNLGSFLQKALYTSKSGFLIIVLKKVTKDGFLPKIVL